jgi:MSHA biogenesis protein MshQ
MIANMKPVFQRFSIVAMLAVALLSVADRAMATDISGNLTADNGFYAYVSTNPLVLGTFVASGGDWGTTYSFSGVTLTPGVTNYLQIEAVNWGYVAGFIGSFTLSDSNFQFANGTQTLVTEATDTAWVGGFNDWSNGPLQPWVLPTGGVGSFGINSVGPWGYHPAISPNAYWIWPSDSNSWSCGEGNANGGNCTVDLMTAIYYEGPTSTPEPGTLLLFGSGIVALAGAIRRKLA